MQLVLPRTAAHKYLEDFPANIWRHFSFRGTRQVGRVHPGCQGGKGGNVKEDLAQRHVGRHVDNGALVDLFVLLLVL